MKKKTTIEDRKFAIGLGKWMHQLIDRTNENGGRFVNNVKDKRTGKGYILTLESNDGVKD